MKALLIAATTCVFTLSAQSESLVEYDFNNLNSFLDSNIASYCAPCVAPLPLTLNGLTQSLHFSGGPDNSKFRCFAGWDTSYDYSFVRSDLTQAADTLGFEFNYDTGTLGAISNISLDYKRPQASAPSMLQASIYWWDDAGIVQHRSSGPVSLEGTGIWNSLTLDFTQGSAALPTGAAIGGEGFLVELYAYGNQGGTLFMDNVAINGSVAKVPEPAGALLIGSAGLLALFRRRRLV